MSDRGADDVPVTRRDDEADNATGATRREGVGVRKSGATPPSDTFSRGTLIGRYVLIEILGAGGMGVVYTAFDPELDRKVAIKVLQARPGGSESGGQTWLLREAQAMARLAHPHVVAVYDVGAMAGEMVFVAMELVEGGTLRAWLKAAKRPWREVLGVMRAAGAGLAAAHAAGLIHRDFKPDNVLVGGDGRVRVMDFGLARLHGTEEQSSRSSDLKIEKRSPLSQSLTEAGALLGTPAYMAPEIYTGSPANALADQFAFGVAMYEALYRKRPFDRDELVEKRAVLPEPPTSAGVPTWLERIVLKTIAIDPAHRYPSMDALLADLAIDPSVARRRIAIGAAVVAIAGGAIATGVVMGHRHTVVAAPSPCLDAESKLADVWDAKTRRSVETAFDRIGKPFAKDSLHGVETVLDAYAKSWVAMRTEACKATRVHGSQSEAVMTLRMNCLDDRKVELATLVGLYTAADEAMVLSAVGPATKLSKLDGCADVPALLAPDPLPKDPKAHELHDTLTKARVIYKSSKLTDTLAMLTKIAPEVEKLGHLPTTAELHLLTGQTLWSLQGGDKAEPEMLKAVTAAEAGKADQIKTEAWLQLTNLANEGNHFEVAAQRLEQAKASLARLGTNWDLQTRVMASEALLLSRQNKYDEALAIMAKARAVAEKHTEGPQIAYVLLVQASIQTSGGRAQDAVETFRQVLAQQDRLGHHRIDVAVTLQSLGTAEMSTGQLDAAIPHFQEALAINESIFGAESTEVAKALSALAAVQLEKGDGVGALASHQRALAIAENTVGKQDAFYAFELGLVADTLVQLQRPKEAIPYLDRALPIQVRAQGEGSIAALTIMLTKCDAQNAIGAHKPAIATCQRALALAEKSLGKDSPLLFLFLAKLGTALADANKHREAVPLLDRAIALGAPDPSYVAGVQMLAARAKWASGNKAGAVALAHAAHETFAKLGDAKATETKDAADWLAAHE